MKRTLSLVVCGTLAIGITIYSGISHGTIRHDLGFGIDLTERGERLSNIPHQLFSSDGELRWEIEGDRLVMSDDVCQLLECRHYFNANYVSTDRQHRVTVLVLLGPSGPTALHKPERCMPAHNFQLVEGPEEVYVPTSGMGEAKILASNFRSGDLRNSMTRVGYAWTTDGNWCAPEDSRRFFAGEPFLYKIQIYCSKPSDHEWEAVDAVSEFASVFIDQANPVLF